MEEGQATAMLRATRHPLIAVDAGKAVRLANRAFYEMFRAHPDDTIGHPLSDLGNGQWDIPELQDLIDGVIADRHDIRDFRVRHDFPALGLRTLLIDAVHLSAADGSDRVLLGFEDVTEQEAAWARLTQAKAFAENVVETIHEGVIVLNADLVVEAVNTPFCTAFELEREACLGRLVFDIGNGEWQVPRLRQALESILPEEDVVHDWEVDHTFDRVGRRIFTLSARRIVGEPMILVVVRDITALKQGVWREETLRRELQHRIRNILANVQAIARLTARGTSDLDAFGAAFDDRIAGLIRSNDLISREGPEGVSLHHLVRSELNARAAKEGLDYTLDGADARLQGDVAQTFGLALHELATNAVKHGALKPGVDAALEIRTSRTDGAAGAEMAMAWRERGLSLRPSAMKPGYGTRLITAALPSLTGGRATLQFHPEGLEALMTVPLSPADGKET